MPNVPGTPTEVCTYVAGALEIWVGTGASALEFLGRTVNGVEIEEHPFIGPIASDESGGDQGPPADYQRFGTQHRLTLEMHKFSAAILAKLDIFYNAVTLAPAAQVGSLLVCGTGTFRLLICTSNLTSFVRNYPVAFILDPISLAPVGSQATRARLTFTANAVGAALPWNVTTS